MSFRLPLSGSAAREAMGDLAHVAEVLDPKNVAHLPATFEAIAQAKRTMAENPAIRRVNVIALRGDSDERWLISIGPRGGWKKLWNFGNGRD